MKPHRSHPSQGIHSDKQKTLGDLVPIAADGLSVNTAVNWLPINLPLICKEITGTATLVNYGLIFFFALIQNMPSPFLLIKLDLAYCVHTRLFWSKLLVYTWGGFHFDSTTKHWFIWPSSMFWAWHNLVDSSFPELFDGKTFYKKIQSVSPLRSWNVMEHILNNFWKVIIWLRQ